MVTLGDLPQKSDKIFPRNYAFYRLNIPYAQKVQLLDTPKMVDASRRIVEMLNEFTNLSPYTSLPIIEATLPFPYICLLPPRHGLVAFSAYSCLISRNHGEAAQFAHLAEYVGIQEPEVGTHPAARHKYREFQKVIVSLLRSFNLYDLCAPFSYFLGHTRSRLDSHEHFRAKALSLMGNHSPLPEWESISSPSRVLVSIYRALVEYGFLIALQFTRYFFRGARKIHSIVDNGYAEQSAFSKIKSITERYLRIEEAIKRIQQPQRIQSSIEDWF